MQSEHELELPELDRLESRRRDQVRTAQAVSEHAHATTLRPIFGSAPKVHKLVGSHRLENLHLLDEHLPFFRLPLTLHLASSGNAP
jgi:hypothetical protein